MNNKSRFTLNERNLPWVGALAGACIALWGALMTQGVINRDGTLYIRVAELFLQGDWKAAITLYSWPLYPLLIAGAHYITGLSLQNSGHALAIVFYGMATGMFACVLREAGGTRNVMIAGIALWFSTPYLVGDIVPMVVREHGFWAFLLCGLWFLLRFTYTPQWKYTLGWGASALIATLFRIEGIIFLTLLPCAFMFHKSWSWKEKLARLLQANTPMLLTMSLIAVLLLSHTTLTLNDLGRLREPVDYVGNIYRDISHSLDSKSTLYADQVLGEFLNDYAKAGLILTLLWAFFVKVVGTAGFLQSALAVSMLKRNRYSPTSTAWPLLLLFTAIGLANAMYILFSKFLLPGRMASPIAFSIIIFSAFALAKLHDDWKKGKCKKITWALVMLILGAQFIASVWPPSSKNNYEVRAVRWVVEHKQANEKVFFDHPRLYHYAGEAFPSDKFDSNWEDTVAIFEHQTVRQFAYVVIHRHKRKPEEEQFVTKRLGSPVMRFDNGRGKEILIYRVSPPSPE